MRRGKRDKVNETKLGRKRERETRNPRTRHQREHYSSVLLLRCAAPVEVGWAL